MLGRKTRHAKQGIKLAQQEMLTILLCAVSYNVLGGEGNDAEVPLSKYYPGSPEEPRD